MDRATGSYSGPATTASPESHAPHEAPSARETLLQAPKPIVSASGLKLKGIDAHYAGENIGESARWKELGADYTVKYFNDSERAAAAITIKNGLMYRADGRLFDSRGRPDGQGAIFVVDGAGTIYATNQQQEGVIHHSSLQAGKPVSMAGEMTVIDGQLTSVNNFSGHYKPDVEQFGQMRENLAAQGIDLSKVGQIAATAFERPDASGKPRMGIVKLDPDTGKVIQVLSRVEPNANGAFGADGRVLSSFENPLNEHLVALTPQQLAGTEVIVQGGKLVYKSNGVALDTVGEAKFVIDPQGRMYAASSTDPTFDHGSFLNGGDVHLAGSIVVDHGTVTLINNKSINYSSSVTQATSETINLRDAAGLDLSRARFGTFEQIFIDNPDGTKRAVTLATGTGATRDASGNPAILEISDTGPPSLKTVPPVINVPSGKAGPSAGGTGNPVSLLKQGLPAKRRVAMNDARLRLSA